MGTFAEKAKNLYKNLCQTEWNATVTGVIIAILSILIMAWWRPWGAVGAVRNWGEWILYGLGVFDTPPPSFIINSGSVIGIGFVAGAFVSACLGNDFSFKFPPPWELCKAVMAGILMGIGSAFAGGCNVGGMYNAIGNLAANGFTMWIGLVIGVIMGLKYIYWEMEHVTWGTSGGKNIDFPFALKIILAIITILALVWGAYTYSASDDSYVASLSGILLISAGLGYAMQRGRWCMVQAFREPHMTGDCTLAKSVALSIMIVAIGAAVLKYAVPQRGSAVAVETTVVSALEDLDVDEISDEELADTLDDVIEASQQAVHGAQRVLDPVNYVRGTFGWGGILGGILFGLGAMLAGGCGSGTLWRVGEGQMKLWLVVPFFGVTNALMVHWFKAIHMEGVGPMHVGSKLGKHIYLPDVFGYGGTLLLIAIIMGLWYLIVDWNEDTNKFIVNM
ncbi:hypothetical protein DBT_0017 [Dissulfuribacter thermophilus]|uniref:YeeE/YedE family protein n=1 Tax=Dissulfuribacter thermophilus TaxID=1156395 RepID=A0A1B9F8G9_9BACT|nr:YeeE/YedE thiosulfate transporter family protein [Dissulfuribacter thermophilus]OCC16200.1 hypothetical protein DBT_0017 [Dissulfuribacter thermophilus]